MSTLKPSKSSRNKASVLLNEKHAGDFSEYVDFCYSHQYDGEEEYAEYHHILPRSTFPEMRYEPQFIVRLGYADHIEAHRLLVKIKPIRQYIKPLNFMLLSSMPYKEDASESVRLSWEKWRGTEGYERWLKKRIDYASKVFSVDGDKYHHIINMNKRARSSEANEKRKRTLITYYENNEEARSFCSKRNKANFENDPELIPRIRESVLRFWDNLTPEEYEERRLVIAERNAKEENRKKNSASVRAYWSKEETRKAQSERLKGKGWWTNGEKDVKSSECPGEGWSRGRSIKWSPEKTAKREATIKKRKLENET